MNQKKKAWLLGVCGAVSVVLAGALHTDFARWALHYAALGDDDEAWAMVEEERVEGERRRVDDAGERVELRAHALRLARGVGGDRRRRVAVHALCPVGEARERAARSVDPALHRARSRS